MKNQYKSIIIQKKQNNLAFTLVELIVVITILAILGTIAFISLQGYSKQARDSRRISDISNIKTSLELFSLQKGNYPTPDNGQIVSYSGDTVWIQGIVGNNVTTNLSRNLQKKPVDPLFDIEYIYSLAYSQKEYELMSIFEGDVAYISYPNHLPRGEGLGVKSSYASDIYQVKVDGNYNQIFVKTQNYIMPTPSIITSEDTSSGLVLDDINIDSQIITGGNNFPNIGIPNITKIIGGLDIKLSVTGIIDSNSTTEEKESVITAIQTAYSDSLLANTSIYTRIINTTNVETLAEELILNSPTGGVENTTPSYTCDESTKPIDNGNITYLTGTPTEINQSYLENSENCGFICDEGFVYSEGDNECILDTVSGDCNSLPNNAVYYNGSTSYSISSALAGTTLEATNAGHQSNPTINTCEFKCEPGYYWVGSICTTADMGYYVSIYGATSQIPASAGYYVSTVGATSQTACGGNTQYQGNTGQSSCNTVSSGYYTTGGTSTTRTGQSQCEAGYYCVSGVKINASVGYYVSTVGATSQIPASAGYYVSTVGTTSQTACGGNTQYQGNTGQSSCNTVSSGYYTTGGTSTTRTGQSQCEAGYYCVSGVKYTCPSGTTSSVGAASTGDCNLIDSGVSGWTYVGNSLGGSTDYSARIAYTRDYGNYTDCVSYCNGNGAVAACWENDGDNFCQCYNQRITGCDRSPNADAFRKD